MNSSPQLLEVLKLSTRKGMMIMKYREFFGQKKRAFVEVFFRYGLHQLHQITNSNGLHQNFSTPMDSNGCTLKIYKK